MTQAHPVSLPVFGAASSQDAAAAGGGEQHSSELAAQGDWQMDTGGDGMDFDLLAEYLLDDNPSGSVAFDFSQSGDSAPGSAIVSPEQSVDGAAVPGQPEAAPAPPPSAPAPAPYHAPPAPPVAAQQPFQPIQQQPLPPAQPTHYYQPHMVMAPAPAAPAPAPLAPTPAPMSSMPPTLAAQGMNLPVPPPIAYAHPQTHIAPAPAVTSQSGVNAGIAQQPSTAVTKRRRVDATAPIAAASNAAVAAAGTPAPPVIADPMAVAAALQGRGRKKTQAQIDRRRERNRILARRTRLRKKFFFESLQKEVVDLQRENAALKEIVRAELEAGGEELLSQCNASSNLPPAVLEACGESASDFDSQDFNLVRSIQKSQHSFVITDPSLQDNPIVFASDDFLQVTGYSREEVLGRNCRFLQGPETCKAKLAQMKKNLDAGEDVTVTLVNYTADGTPFWNKLFIAALRDSASNIVNFIGVIVKVASPEPGDPEEGKVIDSESVGDENEAVTDMKVESGTAAMVADGTVKAIEGAVDAAVAAASSVVQG